MKFISVKPYNKTLIVSLQRGKVNAINKEVVTELSTQFDRMADEPEIKSVILTGSGKFFSFGLDVPNLYDTPIDEFTEFLHKFTALYRQLFLFPKPVIAVVNGHAVAGGCILALTADYRIMNAERGKIGLNEITFGAGLFAGVMAMLKHQVGGQTAGHITLRGELFGAEKARKIGLVEQVAPETDILSTALSRMDLTQISYPESYAMHKQLHRQPVVDNWMRHEKESIKQFVEIWFSPPLRESLKKIVIE